VNIDEKNDEDSVLLAQRSRPKGAMSDSDRNGVPEFLMILNLLNIVAFCISFLFFVFAVLFFESPEHSTHFFGFLIRLSIALAFSITCIVMAVLSFRTFDKTKDVARAYWLAWTPSIALVVAMMLFSLMGVIDPIE
jgi:uncharacterized membrane protein YozB (DUF420 family)